jgi:hypothetical protein
MYCTCTLAGCAARWLVDDGPDSMLGSLCLRMLSVCPACKSVYQKKHIENIVARQASKEPIYHTHCAPPQARTCGWTRSPGWVDRSSNRRTRSSRSAGAGMATIPPHPRPGRRGRPTLSLAALQDGKGSASQDRHLEHLECVLQSRSPVCLAKKLEQLRVGDIGLRSPVGTAGPSIVQYSQLESQL